MGVAKNGACLAHIGQNKLDLGHIKSKLRRNLVSISVLEILVCDKIL